MVTRFHTSSSFALSLISSSGTNYIVFFISDVIMCGSVRVTVHHGSHDALLAWTVEWSEAEAEVGKAIRSSVNRFAQRIWNLVLSMLREAGHWRELDTLMIEAPAKRVKHDPSTTS